MMQTAESECSPERPPLAVGVPEAARLLSISERQAWYLVKSGKLPTTTVGRRRLVLVEELRRCLEQGLLADEEAPEDSES